MAPGCPWCITKGGLGYGLWMVHVTSAASRTRQSVVRGHMHVLPLPPVVGSAFAMGYAGKVSMRAVCDGGEQGQCCLYDLPGYGLSGYMMGCWS